MLKHEEYESLCALALLGQLSADEHRDLISHMHTCESCSRAAYEFVDVIENLPVEGSEASSREIRDLQEDARLEQFLSRAQGEGVVFSKDVLKQERARAWAGIPIRVPRYAFGAGLAAALVLAAVLAGSLIERSRPAPVSAPVPARPRPQAEAQLVQKDEEIAALQSQLSGALNGVQANRQEVSELTRRLAASERDRDALRSQLSQSNEAFVRITAKSSDQEQQLVEMSAEAKKTAADRDQAFTTMVVQQSRLRDLESELNSAHAATEQERQLNAAAHDVRELMGARNLHIIDVYDSDNRSKSARSFGRVIYTEGKSLIFYAFDLDKARGIRKVSFQAWGEREGQHSEPRKLGVFYVDDAAQRRWVMKVSDAEKLRSIDTVFVTVESHGDANSPKGERLLQAFLGSRPNHP